LRAMNHKGSWCTRVENRLVGIASMRRF
jgi:hypothetical protein